MRSIKPTELTHILRVLSKKKAIGFANKLKFRRFNVFQQTQQVIAAKCNFAARYRDDLMVMTSGTLYKTEKYSLRRVKPPGLSRLKDVVSCPAHLAKNITSHNIRTRDSPVEPQRTPQVRIFSFVSINDVFRNRRAELDWVVAGHPTSSYFHACHKAQRSERKIWLASARELHDPSKNAHPLSQHAPIRPRCARRDQPLVLVYVLCFERH